MYRTVADGFSFFFLDNNVIFLERKQNLLSVFLLPIFHSAILFLNFFVFNKQKKFFFFIIVLFTERLSKVDEE